jgi:RNA polymerase sigma factor (sigma-70 family)
VEVSALKYSGVGGLHGRSPLLRLQSDERLVALMRRGNHAAFEHLVGRYQSRLLAFCRHMLGSVEDAEDVLQDVFAAAFNAILADNRPINVRPWLYRIARNRSLNHLRRVHAIGVDSMDVHLSDHGETTADQVHRQEEFRLLIGDIHDLPETQRTALLLREMEALSYEQIAEAMETTIPSVKSLLVRARVSLAEAAEARQLTCAEVRLELGEVAEGLRRRTSAPVRRHLRGCERCSKFRVQLQQTNRALAALLPIGPLVVLRKLVFSHLGHGAGAGAGSHATAAAGSTAMAGSTVAAGSSAAAGSSVAAGGTAAAAAGSTAAVGSTVAAGSAVVAGTTAAAGSSATGLISAGVGAVATKAAAGLAAAALVTAGAVEVGQNNRHSQALDGAPVAAAVIVPAGKQLSASTLRARAADRGALKAITLKKAKVQPAKSTAVPVVPVTVNPVKPVATPPAAAPTAGRTETTTISTTLPTTGVGTTTGDGAASTQPSVGTVGTPPATVTTPTSTTGSCSATAPGTATTPTTTTTGATTTTPPGVMTAPSEPTTTPTCSPADETSPGITGPPPAGSPPVSSPPVGPPSDTVP